MKKRFLFYPVFIILFLPLFITGCVREKLPTLTTAVVSDIGPTSATSGGVITSDGNTNIIVRGVCWGTKKSPTWDETRTTDGYGTGSFTSNITQLTPNTLYYVRAYANNSVGTSYGNQVTFTSSQFSVATLTTTAISAITQTTAVSGGNITSDGGAAVTQRGVCWSTHTIPTISDTKTNDGIGTGSFTSNLTVLTGNTKYYVRAYATNTEGTSYGQEIMFTTSPVLPTLTTSNPIPTSTTTATGGGEISNDGGATLTARGVCWSTAANPTIANSKTTDGSGTGSFISSLTGLAVNTEYHVRAYATNSAGTAYGTDKSFRTDPATVNDYDGNVYNVVRIGTQLWTKENLKTTRFNEGTAIPLVTDNAAWGSLTTPGYCWYDNNSITYKDTYGALYNWYTVHSENLCPTGWHVSTDNEWITLENFFGGASPAGGKLKETGTTHWITPNTGATNESSFTALPGGYRLNNGQFDNIGKYGYWWSSSEYTAPDAWSRRMQFDSDKVFRYYINESYGKSVRCIKD